MDDLSILYVEDDVGSRLIMQMLIRGRMKIPHLTMFEDSRNFVPRLLAVNPSPTLIFLDIHLKPFDGFEMLKTIRQQPQFNPVPIVAITASVMNEEVERLRAAGFNGCLAKPIDAENFPEDVRRICNGEAVWHIS
jgi:two-component system cell cycle response regulator DivK